MPSLAEFFSFLPHLPGVPIHIKTIELSDPLKFLGNCPPTPPLSRNFSLSEKQVLMLT